MDQLENVLLAIDKSHNTIEDPKSGPCVGGLNQFYKPNHPTLSA